MNSKQEWTYNEITAEVEGMDSGNCMTLKALPKGGTVEERDRHGYLIAAAPDLLEACKEAIPLLVLLGNYIGNDNGRCETILKLKDAIEKAEAK